MFKDPRLNGIWDKVESGARVSADEILPLFETHDVLGLGKIANVIKEGKTGNRVTYVVNRQINPTNLCVLSCRFCDYASKKGRPDAYALTLEEILAKCSSELKEVHIVGGLNHEWPFEHYL